MKKVVYIVTDYSYQENKVYTNKETAEKRAEQINYNKMMGGHRGHAEVVEMEVVEE